VRGGDSKGAQASFKRLPFNFCALSLQPFTTPVCTAAGVIFDHENILRWLLKHETNPTDGSALKQGDLIKLEFARNAQDEYVDPVTYKVFTDNTHIVAIRHGASANVFAYDTIERLNVKAKMWRDLVSDEEFSRKDLITLQDPQNVELRNLSSFKYLKDGEDSGVPKEEASINSASLGSAADLKIMRAKEVVAKARAERANAQLAKGGDSNSLSTNSSKKTTSSSATNTSQSKSTPYNATRHTTGLAAASFTSTGVTPHTSASLALMSDEEYLLKRGRVKEKGYVRMRTTHGSLYLTLLPEHAPKAVWNFTRLVQKGYYDGVSFHRNMRNFMIQGGDPTGTGKGGTSIWGRNFSDEFEGPLKHDGRGTLSMANKGKNTNSSQFFIAYRPARHLDNKHTIFGHVDLSPDDDAGRESAATLKALEDVPVDSGDRPKEDVKILEAKVFIDSFDEFWKKKKDSDERERRVEETRKLDRTTWTGKRIRDDGGGGNGDSATGGGGVGKYLKASLAKAPAQQQARPNDGGDDDDDEILKFIDDVPDEPEPVRKKTKGPGGFGNFDGW
jgi:peptidyl-prolyl cis-trans isomerase-like protein 2